MSNDSQENLKDLIKCFYSNEETFDVLGDIELGDKLLQNNPSPKPSKKLIAAIKADISNTIKRSKYKALKSQMYRLTAAAAVLVILLAVSIFLDQNSTIDHEQTATATVLAASIWESEDIRGDDELLALLTAEIEELERELIAVDLGELNGESVGEFDELEAELIEINTEFWKG